MDGVIPVIFGVLVASWWNYARYVCKSSLVIIIWLQMIKTVPTINKRKLYLCLHFKYD